MREGEILWPWRISRAGYRYDVLILTGDVADTLRLLDWCLPSEQRR